MAELTFESTKKQVEELVEKLILAQKETSELVKALTKDVKINSIESLSKQYAEMSEKAKVLDKVLKEKQETNKDILKIEKELITINETQNKATKKRIELTDEEIKQNLIEKEANALRVKQIKALIEIEKGEAKTLDAVRKQIIGLKIARDQLNFKEDAKEVAIYNVAINSLQKSLEENVDEQTKAKYNVGQYAEGIKEALGDTINFGEAQTFLTKTLAVLRLGLKKYSDEQEKAKKKQEETGKSVSILGSVLKGLGKAVVASGIGLLVVALTSIVSSFGDTETGAKTLAKVTGNLLNGFKFLGAFLVDYLPAIFSNIGLKAQKLGLEMNKMITFDKAKLNQIEVDLKTIDEQIKANQKTTEGFSWKTFSDGLIETSNATNKLIESQFALKKIQRDSNLEISKRVALEQKLLAIADDDTRGFNERIEYSERLNKILASNNSATALKLQLASKELEVARNQLELSKQTTANHEATLTAIDELNQAEIKYQEAKGERDIQRIEVNQKLRKVLFDAIEQEVDYLIDGNEQIKMSNEKLINNDKINLQKRVELLNKTQNLILESNKKVQDAVAKSVDGLTGDEIREAFKNANGDVEKLRINLDKLGLAEIPINVLLTLFREMATQARDFADSIETSNVALAEFQEIEKQITLQTELLKAKTYEERLKLQEEYNDKSLQLEIDNLKEMLLVVQKGSLEQAKLQKQLNDLLLQQQQQVFDKENAELEKQKAIREKSISELQKLAESALDRELARSQRQSDFKIKLLEREIDASQKQQDILQEQIAKGDAKTSANAVKAYELERQREIERTEFLRKEKEKQMRYELALGIVKALASGGGINNNSVNNIASLLPKYKMGTNDHKGGLAIVGDGGVNEYVQTPDGKTFMTPKRDTLVDLPQHSKVFKDLDTFSKEMFINLPPIPKQNAKNDAGLIELKEINKSLKNQTPVQSTVNYDTVNKMIVEKTRVKNQIKVKKTFVG